MEKDIPPLLRDMVMKENQFFSSLDNVIQGLQNSDINRAISHLNAGITAKTDQQNNLDSLIRISQEITNWKNTELKNLTDNERWEKELIGISELSKKDIK